MVNFKSKLISQCLAEMIGLALILFMGAGCVSVAVVSGATMGIWEICIIWGITFALAIYLTAGVSGAHLNPAVTIALWLCAGFDKRKVLPYIFAQMAGGFIGAALAYLCYFSLFEAYEVTHSIVRGSEESLVLASIFSTYANPNITVAHAAVIEVLITAILMMLIMALLDDKNGLPKGPLAPLLIGLLVAVIGGATAPLTGFAMNPARDFGPKLFTFFAGWGEMSFTGGRDIPYFLVPLIAPVLGAFLGAKLYLAAFDKILSGNKAEEKEFAEQNEKLINI
ncbi:aquaporin [Shewanella sp. D64]|uniref:MIP/aquaporin family protein n=1 Tax=unclassified Shewanella TaxID=196818 RepID=UPI0022BA4166|nr:MULTISPECIES: MIP/aquaporin family protein [unclassified Shewanella]MEC4725579.1 aquaporin [Shewanella sp. D64]MEC4739631.1 aquaporin [Shewanella sp. E94]WBJ94902.1 aquaporin [Shewanella sp. MTB7]